MELMVGLKEKSYPIYIEQGLLDETGRLVKTVFSGKKIAVITDENVDRHYGQRIEELLSAEGYLPHRLVLPPGEQTKTMDSAMTLYGKLLEKGFGRKDLIITLGGGVIGDLGGFVAATYLRGIPFIQIPTSLLAQIDSSVGGKVGIDLSFGKNLVGAFYQPKMVIIDPRVLSTLTDRYFNDGMAEAIKYGAIFDKELFEFIRRTSFSKTGEGEAGKDLEHLIYTCCKWKSIVVERDEKEAGERALLNFGHTLGHSIEKSEGYSGVTHGEGVAIGMATITRGSEALGLTKAGTTEELIQVIRDKGLPVSFPKGLEEDILQNIWYDKKVEDDAINLILLKEIGKSYMKKEGKEGALKIIKEGIN